MEGVDVKADERKDDISRGPLITADFERGAVLNGGFIEDSGFCGESDPSRGSGNGYDSAGDWDWKEIKIFLF